MPQEGLGVEGPPRWRLLLRSAGSGLALLFHLALLGWLGALALREEPLRAAAGRYISAPSAPAVRPKAPGPSVEEALAAASAAVGKEIAKPAPPRYAAQITLTGGASPLSVGERMEAVAVVVNQSEQAGRFGVRFNLWGPSGRVATQGYSVTLEPGRPQPVSFQWSPSPASPLGKYTLRAHVSQGGRILAEAGLPPVELADSPPRIALKAIDLRADVGRKATFRVLVEDDRGVEQVQVSYVSLETGLVLTEPMKRLAGDGRSGEWMFESETFQRSGKFSFQVSATDTAGQTSRSERYEIPVIARR